MRALILTSDKLRHKYFIHSLSQKFEICGLIRQPKKNYYKDEIINTGIVRGHFEKLGRTENQFFSEYTESDKNIDLLEIDDINAPAVIDWASAKKPDVIFLFGTRILSSDWIKSFGPIINYHLGLSPYYRGSATLFWPFVNQELSCIGVTIHLAVEAVDAGPIIARIKPDLSIGDDYYQINYKSIQKGIDLLPGIAIEYLNGSIAPVPQSKQEQLYLYKKSDFTTEALQKALDFVGNGLTQGQLDSLKDNSQCSC